MANITLKARPSNTITLIARTVSGKAARFSFAKFGQARFGKQDGVTLVVRPNTTITLIVRP